MKKQLTCAVLAFAFAFNLTPISTPVEVSAVHYDFGNVKTRDNTYIEELRGVPVDGIVNLARITVPGQTIVGWYFDAAFTQPVEDEIWIPAGFVTITEEVMTNGLYPKYASDTTGGATTGTTDTTTDSTTDSNTSVTGPTVVPSTGVAVLGQLF